MYICVLLDFSVLLVYNTPKGVIFMKRFVLGFIIGGVICSALTGFAVEYAVSVNPFPVKVNGVETTIEGYNINDNTYFKLRDVAAAIGGFEVGFEGNAITITTPQTEPPTSTETPVVDESLPDIETEIIDGVEYVTKGTIEMMLDDIGLGNYTFAKTQFFDGSDYSKPSLLTDIPLHPKYNQYIPYDYYISTIVPIINNLR